MKSLGIIGAMEEEIILIQEHMRNYKTIQRGQLTFFTGKIEENQIVLVRSGIGKVNAALCTQILISEFKVDCVLNSGIAGGMDNRLHLFDIVLSTDTVYHDFDTRAFGYGPTIIPRMETSVFVADARLRKLAVCAYESSGAKGQLFEGRVASGDQFIADKEKKAYITGICTPLCVEMEGAAVAHVCTINKVPFLIMRCISDMAETETDVFNEKKAAEICAGIAVAFAGMV